MINEILNHELHHSLLGVHKTSAKAALTNFGITATRKLYSEMIADTGLGGTATLGKTHQSIVALDSDYDAIQLVFGNIHTSAYDFTASIFPVAVEPIGIRPSKLQVIMKKKAVSK